MNDFQISHTTTSGKSIYIQTQFKEERLGEAKNRRFKGTIEIFRESDGRKLGEVLFRKNNEIIGHRWPDINNKNEKAYLFDTFDAALDWVQKSPAIDLTITENDIIRVGGSGLAKKLFDLHNGFFIGYQYKYGETAQGEKILYGPYHDDTEGMRVRACIEYDRKKNKFCLTAMLGGISEGYTYYKTRDEAWIGMLEMGAPNDDVSAHQKMAWVKFLDEKKTEAGF